MKIDDSFYREVDDDLVLDCSFFFDTKIKKEGEVKEVSIANCPLQKTTYFSSRENGPVLLTGTIQLGVDTFGVICLHKSIISRKDTCCWQMI